jgi:uncharacterized protein YlzI (FlbEa/FlbD family)
MNKPDELIALINGCKAMARTMAEQGGLTEEKLREFVRGTIETVRSHPDGDELLILLAEAALMKECTKAVRERVTELRKN